jgi:metaxin
LRSLEICGTRRICRSWTIGYGEHGYVEWWDAEKLALITGQLYCIYLSQNFASLAETLYILPTSSNPFVRLTIARELRLAAEQELLKFSTVINAETLYNQAEEAFAALETLLGNDDWFFGASGPSLFDASVFAYTHLLLDDALGKGWLDTRLRDALMTRKRLIAHRDRISGTCFAETS